MNGRKNPVPAFPASSGAALFILCSHSVAKGADFLGLARTAWLPQNLDKSRVRDYYGLARTGLIEFRM